MRVVDGFEEETKGALELLDDGLCEGGELDRRVLIVDIFGELGNGLCVGFGLKTESLALEEGLQFLVVGNDTVVNDRKLPFWVRSGAMS